MFEIHFSPKPGDMDVDDIIQRSAPARFLPDVPGQCVSRYDLIFMAHQVFEKFKFPHRQIHALNPSDDFSGNEIHVEIANAQMQRVFGSSSPQQCPDAGKKFSEGEGFHQIVVCAAVQAMHTILKSIARGQKENRSFKTALTDRGEHLNAVAARQHPIEKNDVELCSIDLKESLFTGGRKCYVVALSLEPLLQRMGNFLFVFNDQDSHVAALYQ